MIVFEKNSETALSDMVDKLGDGSGLSAACFFFSRLSSGYCTKYRIRMAVSVIEDVFADYDGFTFIASNLDVIVVFNSDDRKLFDEAVYRLYYLFIEDPQIKVLGMEGFLAFYPLPEAIDAFMDLCSLKIDGSGSDYGNLAGVSKESELFDFFDVVYEKLSGMDINEMVDISEVFAFAPDGGSGVSALSLVSVNSENLLDLFGSSFCVYLLAHLECVLSHAILDFISINGDSYTQSVTMIKLMPSVVLSRAFLDFVNVLSKQKVMLVIDMDISGFFMDRKAFFAAVDVIASEGCELCVSNVTLSEIVLLNNLRVNISIFRVSWSSDFFNLELSNSKDIDKRRIIVCDCNTRDDFLLACAEGFCLFNGKLIDSMVENEKHTLSHA